MNRTSSEKQPRYHLGLPKVPADIRCFLPLVVLVLLGPALTIAGDEPKVMIEGGVRSDNRQFYDWKVTNHHTSPIIYIEFPHYHGDTFIAPAGWAQEWKNRSMVGGKNAPGWVRTNVESPTEGIPPGGSAGFQMRIARAGALARPGQVAVRFADGTELIVADVELPSAQSFLEQNIMVFGLGLIFVVALLIHFHRRRKPSLPATPTETDGKE